MRQDLQELCIGIAAETEPTRRPITPYRILQGAPRIKRVSHRVSAVQSFALAVT